MITFCLALNCVGFLLALLVVGLFAIDAKQDGDLAAYKFSKMAVAVAVAYFLINLAAAFLLNLR